MKKIVSFSQVTFLSLALFSTKQMTASSPEGSPKEEAPVLVSTQAMQPQGSSFVNWLFGEFTTPQSASSKPLTQLEQLERDIINAAQDGSLVQDGKINKKFTKDLDTALLGGQFASALTKASNARLSAIQKMLTDAEAQRATFLEQDHKNSQTIEQLLLAAQASKHVNVPQVKAIQLQCKDGRDCLNAFVAKTIESGHAFSTNSQNERAKMDDALMAGGGTKAFTGQTSPRQEQNEYIKQFTKKDETKKARTLDLTSDRPLILIKK